ncbi:uncharacterized protein LOC117194317 [Drosophila miranda]|uniref:uncharacterized protein LOC117191889 n=1 Tax=Drosophila miranda TaxID=7229 RepID=UPI00143FB3BF|nr:uncharacterized protein LOC117191889 [Drosophila miranda]XP_033254779.1 uncharacterized protein LOC117194317 [Drosophila miranda]
MVSGMSQNRRYRVNVVHVDFGGDKWNGGNKQGRSVSKGYEEPDLYGEDDDEEDPDAAKIEDNVSGGYKLSVQASSRYISAAHCANFVRSGPNSLSRARRGAREILRPTLHPALKPSWSIDRKA